MQVAQFFFGDIFPAFMWTTRGPLAEVREDDVMPRVGHAIGAARRRREWRLRQFLRHERRTLALALAELQHHTAPRDRRAWAGEVEHEENSKRRLQNPPLLQAASTEYFTVDNDEVYACRGLSWSSAATAATTVRFLASAVHGGLRRRPSSWLDLPAFFPTQPQLSPPCRRQDTTSPWSTDNGGKHLQLNSDTDNGETLILTQAMRYFWKEKQKKKKNKKRKKKKNVDK